MTRWKADLSLVGTAFLFGVTFVVVQEAVEEAEPFPFLAVRFLIGVLVLAPFAWSRPRSPGVWRDGLAAGVALGAGYAFQTIGLQYTTPSVSAFITYLCVVFVPLLSTIVFRRPPHLLTVVGVVIAVVGLILLTGGVGGGGFNRGEWLTVACALVLRRPHPDPVPGGAPSRRSSCSPSPRWSTVMAGFGVIGAFTGGYAIGSTALLAALVTGIGATAVAVPAADQCPEGDRPDPGRPHPAAGAGVRRAPVGASLGERLGLRGASGRALILRGGGRRGGAPAGDGPGRGPAAVAEASSVTPLTLEASGRRFGHYVWVERRLFEVLGAWSGDTEDRAARPVLAANAAHHAWRAGVLADRLPMARGSTSPDGSLRPTRRWPSASSVIAEPGPDETAERLVGVYRVVVPDLVAGLRGPHRSHHRNRRRTGHPVAPARPPRRAGRLAGGASSCSNRRRTSRGPTPTAGDWPICWPRAAAFVGDLRAVQNGVGRRTVGYIPPALRADPSVTPPSPDDRATPPRSRPAGTEPADADGLLRRVARGDEGAFSVPLRPGRQPRLRARGPGGP